MLGRVISRPFMLPVVLLFNFGCVAKLMVVCVCVCVSVCLFDDCVTNSYMHCLVCAFFISCVIPCKNINTTLPSSNILDITLQGLMLLLNLLYVIYLQFCSFHFLHCALHC